jgi:hypothetical protein
LDWVRNEIGRMRGQIATRGSVKNEDDAMTPQSTVPSSSLYKYVDIGRIETHLARIHKAHPASAFNDPFELLPEVVIPVDEPERPIRIALDLMAERRQPPSGRSGRGVGSVSFERPDLQRAICWPLLNPRLCATQSSCRPIICFY